MKRYYNRARTLALSATARDTYTLFIGNVTSAFLAFLFTILVARALSVGDFGIFSAANNLVLMIISVTDLGISSGVINFASKNFSEGNTTRANEYIKAAFLLRLISVVVISFFLIIFSKFITNKFIATSDREVAYWSVIIIFLFLPCTFIPFVLRSKREFLKSSIVDVSVGIGRLLFVGLIVALGLASIRHTLLAYALGALFSSLVGFYFIGVKFARARPQKFIYLSLIRFSGWLGVSSVISAVSGRLDITMLAALLGATATGIYSISSRLAFFIVLLASSYSSVLAPRFASFGDPANVKTYIKKACLALIPMVVGILLWVLIARSFIILLFGEKYIESIPIFKALAAAMIPFLLTVPAVTAIIYAMKKPILVGSFALFQLIATFFMNLYFIPKYGSFGPAITFAIVNTILAVYVWFIVIKYYWPFDKQHVK
ncbi:hypothetical protein A3A76_03655 [Candidatus Woesebacteria bacterium RIFCSPLOWO2_01_FULL_39_23]|uniref:Polysaccharide biosynthesis protein C-terminal domain-containing protein n=1 Tax=Candidatus Woesebacteria bacterium RIFCSPHIGHO2_01_FULL_40_22 TaxID=1802499 RepID=A0A1F7YK27_9BACT|nr:MAG: hypothetical protein A2141_00370 [Candidatus Woesebacteria bacterium RBG_16_40_11]OGM27550.1 MAG: hypothetical protein A2628_02055 [Candidatus Woesebacteria bacterium RIFCSPHIGHO2_01_FULL_40_22]OGM36142.1 MAG: hypothetical protein A3E41_02295 [Candidatus Woesebacteria bacterium RIFCSPHIGHO2_12_FULL_38_9]OGM62724.1 MAG: hypothetical protein A3A76_03655 [Candidatus Woesebacteria bacterium RIFCSPLOWO2_01_FULL_39_23]